MKRKALMTAVIAVGFMYMPCKAYAQMTTVQAQQAAIDKWGRTAFVRTTELACSSLTLYEVGLLNGTVIEVKGSSLSSFDQALAAPVGAPAALLQCETVTLGDVTVIVDGLAKRAEHDRLAAGGVSEMVIAPALAAWTRAYAESKIADAVRTFCALNTTICNTLGLVVKGR